MENGFKNYNLHQNDTNNALNDVETVSLKIEDKIINQLKI